MHFSGLFKDILIKEEVTADGLTAVYSGLDPPPPVICKIGVWLNTCKLCCDYQPLKSSLKINLYIVKFPCLLSVSTILKAYKSHQLTIIGPVAPPWGLLHDWTAAQQHWLPGVVYSCNIQFSPNFDEATHS